jgi:hypothetical protein
VRDVMRLKSRRFSTLLLLYFIRSFVVGVPIHQQGGVNDDETVTLIFVAGLEGTGHQWWSTMLESLNLFSNDKLIATYPDSFSESLMQIWENQPTNGPMSLDDVITSTNFCSVSNEVLISNPGVKFVHIQPIPYMLSWPFRGRSLQNKPDIMGLVKLFEETKCPQFPHFAKFKVKLIWTTRDIRESLKSTVYHRHFASFPEQAFWLQNMLINLHTQISALPMCSWTRVEYSKSLEDLMQLKQETVPRLASWLGISEEVLLKAMLYANEKKHEKKESEQPAIALPSPVEQEKNELITLAYFGAPNEKMWPLAARPMTETVQRTYCTTHIHTYKHMP